MVYAHVEVVNLMKNVVEDNKEERGKMKKLLFLLVMMFTLVSCSSTNVTKKGLVEKYSLNKESAHNWETTMSKVMVAEATNPDWYGEENPLVNFRKQGKISEREYYFLDYLGKTPVNEISDDDFDRFTKILTSYVCLLYTSPSPRDCS